MQRGTGAVSPVERLVTRLESWTVELSGGPVAPKLATALVVTKDVLHSVLGSSAVSFVWAARRLAPNVPPVNKLVALVAQLCAGDVPESLRPWLQDVRLVPLVVASLQTSGDTDVPAAVHVAVRQLYAIDRPRHSSS